jgi:hypothetical protein
VEVLLASPGLVCEVPWKGTPKMVIVQCADCGVGEVRHFLGVGLFGNAAQKGW